MYKFIFVAAIPAAAQEMFTNKKALMQKYQFAGVAPEWLNYESLGAQCYREAKTDPADGETHQFYGLNLHYNVDSGQVGKQKIRVMVPIPSMKHSDLRQIGALRKQFFFSGPGLEKKGLFNRLRDQEKKWNRRCDQYAQAVVNIVKKKQLHPLDFDLHPLDFEYKRKGLELFLKKKEMNPADRLLRRTQFRAVVFPGTARDEDIKNYRFLRFEDLLRKPTGDVSKSYTLDLTGEVNKGGQGMVFHAQEYTIKVYFKRYYPNKQLALKDRESALSEYLTDITDVGHHENLLTHVGSSDGLSVPHNFPFLSERAKVFMESELTAVEKDYVDVMKRPMIVMKKYDFDLLNVIRGNTQAAREIHRTLTSEKGLAPFVYKGLKALGTMHGNGKIHRDVKAENIYINKDMSMVIADFGGNCARVDEPTQSQRKSANFWGTPLSIPPEWAIPRNRSKYEIDNSSLAKVSNDFWAFGTVVYELITGKPYLSKLGTYTGKFGRAYQVYLAHMDQRMVSEFQEWLKKQRPDIQAILGVLLNQDPKMRDTNAINELLKKNIFDDARNNDNRNNPVMAPVTPVRPAGSPRAPSPPKPSSTTKKEVTTKEVTIPKGTEDDQLVVQVSQDNLEVLRSYIPGLKKGDVIVKLKYGDISCDEPGKDKGVRQHVYEWGGQISQIGDVQIVNNNAQYKQDLTVFVQSPPASVSSVGVDIGAGLQVPIPTYTLKNKQVQRTDEI